MKWLEMLQNEKLLATSYTDSDSDTDGAMVHSKTMEALWQKMITWTVMNAFVAN